MYRRTKFHAWIYFLWPSFHPIQTWHHIICTFVRTDQACSIWADKIKWASGFRFLPDAHSNESR
jgi:hypothetical protein